MFISKNGKTYDTADGSEQHWVEQVPRHRTSGQAAKERWEDDGGPMNDPPHIVERLQSAKPVWSVLSLRDLNAHIRREEAANHPARMQQELERGKRQKACEAELKEQEEAAAAQAKQDYHRNAWEHT